MYSFHNMYYIERKEQIASIKRYIRQTNDILSFPTKIKTVYPEKYPAIVVEEFSQKINFIHQIGFNEAMYYLEKAANEFDKIINTEADEEEVGTAIEALKSLRNFQGFLFDRFPEEHKRWLKKIGDVCE